MMPMDGTGYGKSLYWEYKARQVCDESDESCKHIGEYMPKVMFKYETKPQNDFYLRFRVKCPVCKERFYRTESILYKKFCEFYGMNSSS